MYANIDMGIICNPWDRCSRENVQAGSKKKKKSFFLVRKFLQAYCVLQGHKLRPHQKMEVFAGGMMGE